MNANEKESNSKHKFLWDFLLWKLMNANTFFWDFRFLNESNKTFSFLFRGFKVWWTERTKICRNKTWNKKKQFLWIFGLWMEKQMQASMRCKDRYHLSQELKLWYQMLQAGNQGWQNGWWKLDGSTKDMIGWAIWWNASYDPENKCKNKWDMISNMIKQDK